MEPREHWENVYRSRGDAELSWFQGSPEASVFLVNTIVPTPRRAIDVGAGQSLFASALLDAGVEEVAALDISAAALERARARLGPAAGRVRWIVDDVCGENELGPVDLWHDRAVFHFMTRAEDRARYIAAAARAVKAGGHAIVATFAPSGPERCSGLSVCRFDPGTLAAEFSAHFALVSGTSERHVTPWGASQEFAYALMRKLV